MCLCRCRFCCLPGLVTGSMRFCLGSRGGSPGTAALAAGPLLRLSFGWAAPAHGFSTARRGGWAVRETRTPRRGVGNPCAPVRSVDVIEVHEFSIARPDACFECVLRCIAALLETPRKRWRLDFVRGEHCHLLLSLSCCGWLFWTNRLFVRFIPWNLGFGRADVWSNIVPWWAC